MWARPAPYLRSSPKVNRWSIEESSKVDKNMTERASQSKFYLALPYEERLRECGRVWLSVFTSGIKYTSSTASFWVSFHHGACKVSRVIRWPAFPFPQEQPAAPNLIAQVVRMQAGVVHSPLWERTRTQVCLGIRGTRISQQ